MPAPVAQLHAYSIFDPRGRPAQPVKSDGRPAAPDAPDRIEAQAEFSAALRQKVARAP